MFKNESNSRTTTKNIQFPIVLELFQTKPNMLCTWVNEPNFIEDSHNIFLGITPDEVHTQSLKVSCDFLISLLISLLFSLFQALEWTLTFLNWTKSCFTLNLSLKMKMLLFNCFNLVDGILCLHELYWALKYVLKRALA